MESAEGLYSRLEEQLHELVSQSNSCLERLEFLQKVRQLEAEFSKVRRMSLERRCVQQGDVVLCCPQLRILGAFPRLWGTFPRFLMMKEAQRMTGLPEL